LFGELIIHDEIREFLQNSTTIRICNPSQSPALPSYSLPALARGYFVALPSGSYFLLLTSYFPRSALIAEFFDRKLAAVPNGNNPADFWPADSAYALS
jgi:hypothetical protein